MLFSEPTKRGVGLTLYGDSHDLRSLHETVHLLCGSGVGGHDDQQEHALSIAYEIRKAYEGQRDTKRVGKDGNTYFSTNLACGARPAAPRHSCPPHAGHARGFAGT